MAKTLDDVERQLLEYLERQPMGRTLVCEPNLCRAVERLLFVEPRLFTGVYEGPEGCWLVGITDAGKALLSSSQQSQGD